MSISGLGVLLLNAASSSTDPLTIKSKGTVKIDVNGPHGIEIYQTGLGDVSIDGAVDINRDHARLGASAGIEALIANQASKANLTINVPSGTLEMRNASGIEAIHRGSGDVSVTTASDIIAFGDPAHAVFIDFRKSLNLAVTGGKLQTFSRGSPTILIVTDNAVGGYAEANVFIAPGAEIKASQSQAFRDYPMGSSPIRTTFAVGGTVTVPDPTTVAVDLSTGSDTLELHPGFSIRGMVQGGPGSDTINFAGTGSDRFDISRIDTNGSHPGNVGYLNFEEFIKTGDSKWTLSGNNDEISTFRVEAGELAVDGDLSSTHFIVMHDGTLSGTGHLGSVNLTTSTSGVGGFVAPGNSIGVLTIKNDATFRNGTALEVELAANGTSDLLKVGGSTHLQGAFVQAKLTDKKNSYSSGTKYKVLESDNGLVGKFSDVIDNSLLNNMNITYDSNDVYLEVVDADLNPRDLLLAHALDSLDGDGDIRFVTDELYALTEPAALAKALDALRGQIHSDGLVMLADASSRFNRLLLFRGGYDLSSDAEVESLAYSGKADRRIAEAFEEKELSKIQAPTTVWVRGVGSDIEVGRSSGNAGWRIAGTGVAFGVESDLTAATELTSPVVAGAAVGFTHSSMTHSVQEQTADAESLHLGVYARAGAADHRPGWSLRGSLSLASQFVDASRPIAFGSVDREAKSSYRAVTMSSAAELRYGIDANQFLPWLKMPATISPFVRAETDQVFRSAFDEDSGGALGLSSDAQRFSRGLTAVGVAIGGSAHLGDIQTHASLSFAYERLFGDTGGEAALTFPDAASGFVTTGLAEARDRFRFRANTSFGLSRRAVLEIGGEAVLSSDRRELAGDAVLRISF